jgi:hypothetical protein
MVWFARIALLKYGRGGRRELVEAPGIRLRFSLYELDRWSSVPALLSGACLLLAVATASLSLYVFSALVAVSAALVGTSLYQSSRADDPDTFNQTAMHLGCLCSLGCLIAIGLGARSGLLFALPAIHTIATVREATSIVLGAADTIVLGRGFVCLYLLPFILSISVITAAQLGLL